MADEVQGIAVVDDRDPAIERLMIVCVRGSDSRALFGMIPIRRRGSPELYSSWEYDEEGDQLRVTPSVLMTRSIPEPGRESEFPHVSRKEELFHSPGDWRIRFVRWSRLTIEERGPEEDGAYSVWRRLNANLLTRPDWI